MNKRTEINIRTTDEIKAEIKRLAEENSMTLSDYMLNSSLQGKTIEVVTQIKIK